MKMFITLFFSLVIFQKVWRRGRGSVGEERLRDEPLRTFAWEARAEAPSAPPPARAQKRGTVETSPQRPSRGHKKVAVVER